MAIALMVQDLLYLEILPNYDCQAQNPPFWIYVLFNKSWAHGPINHEIWNLEVFRCEESKNNIRNHPSSSVQKLLKILASLPLLGSGTKKGAWPKKIFKTKWFTLILTC